MLLILDAGNSNLHFALHDGEKWREQWRFQTDQTHSEDALAAKLISLLERAGPLEKIERFAIASVVPSLNTMLAQFARNWLQKTPLFVNASLELGIALRYETPHTLGADRLANAVAAERLYGAPIITVDFGTATNLEAVDRDRAFIGGSILPGLLTSMNALLHNAPHLPPVSFEPPIAPIGANTLDSLRSGLGLAYAGGIDALIARYRAELGNDARVIATGGLASMIAPLCESVKEIDSLLTLEGIRLIAALNPDQADEESN